MNIVLVHPEIPPNTGNVARLCVSISASLHLVRPLGFEITDKQLKRAGLDYWQDLDLTYHDDFDALLKVVGDDPIHLATTRATTPHTGIDYTERDWLVFGSETKGLPAEIVERHLAHGIRIPMWGPSRCLNLSNAVAVVAFEALRQLRPAEFYPKTTGNP